MKRGRRPFRGLRAARPAGGKGHEQLHRTAHRRGDPEGKASIPGCPSFTEPLIVEVIQKERRPFRVVRPFVYAVGSPGGGHLLIVPPGFETDFASVPFGFRWLVHGGSGRPYLAALPRLLERPAVRWPGMA